MAAVYGSLLTAGVLGNPADAVLVTEPLPHRCAFVAQLAQHLQENWWE